MEVNVQLTMTHVEKWLCLIYDCFFSSMHYEKKAYKLKETIFFDLHTNLL